MNPITEPKVTSPNWFFYPTIKPITLTYKTKEKLETHQGYFGGPFVWIMTLQFHCRRPPVPDVFSSRGLIGRLCLCAGSRQAPPDKSRCSYPRNGRRWTGRRSLCPCAAGIFTNTFTILCSSAQPFSFSLFFFLFLLIDGVSLSGWSPLIFATWSYNCPLQLRGQLWNVAPLCPRRLQWEVKQGK